MRIRSSKLAKYFLSRTKLHVAQFLQEELLLFSLFFFRRIIVSANQKQPQIMFREKNSQESLYRNLTINKAAGNRSETLLKKRLRHWCFPVNFAKFLIVPFSEKRLRWLLLFFPAKL